MSLVTENRPWVTGESKLINKKILGIFTINNTLKKTVECC